MLLLLLACAPHHALPPVRAHATGVTAARDALVTADLARFRSSMQGVAADFPLGGRAPEVQAGVLAAIARATAAPTLPEAAAAYGELGVACGTCHAATGAVVAGPVTTAAGGDGVRAEMARHDRALALLWAGLVGPSDADLRAGADAFAASTLQPLDGSGPEAEALDLVVTALARDLATGPAAERGWRFGVLLGTCAGCHVAPPPGLEGEPQ